MQQAVLETAALPLELHPYIDTPAGIRTLKTVRFERTVSANFTRGAYGGLYRVWTCDKRINGPPLCLLSYTPTKVADNALPGMVRSREIESRTPRLKVGYSTDWVTSTCRASSVPCLWEHSFEESHFRCAWKWALAENGRVEQPLSGVKAWCLTVWRILEYTLCIIAYTLISLAGIHSSGIRVTWFWFSASKKHPSGVVRLTGVHIVQSMENNRYLDDFIQPSLHYDLHKQTTQNSWRDSNCSTAFAIYSVCSS